MKKRWWCTWYGAPMAFIISLCGFVCHPLYCIGEFLFYRKIGQRGEYLIGWWTTLVRACTDIDMSH